MRAVVAICLCLAACRVAPAIDAERDPQRNASAQTVAPVLVGARGDTGPDGPPSSKSAGAFVAIDSASGTVALSAGTCSSGQLLQASGGAWTCVNDAGSGGSGVHRVIGGPGVSVSTITTSVVLSGEATGTGVDFAAGPHGHFGDKWQFTSVVAGTGLQVENDTAAPTDLGALGAGVIGTAAAAGSGGAGVRGLGYGTNTGRGIIGTSASATRAIGVYGIAGGTNGVGVYGETDGTDAASAGVIGEVAATAPSSWAVLARNPYVGGVGLRTSGGSAVFDQARAITLPIGAKGGTGSTAYCGTGEVAISGSCLAGGAMSYGCLSSDACCAANTGCHTPDYDATPPDRYYCSSGIAYVICLKVN